MWRAMCINVASTPVFVGSISNVSAWASASRADMFSAVT